jgi:hypothetical protein
MSDNPPEEVEALVAEANDFLEEFGHVPRQYDCELIQRLADALSALPKGKEGRDEPVKMILFCPACGEQHIDAPEGTGTFDGPDNNIREIMIWTNPPHRSHLCNACGHIWRPADVPTEGVASIATAGKNDSPPHHPSLRDVTEEVQKWIDGRAAVEEGLIAVAPQPEPLKEGGEERKRLEALADAADHESQIQYALVTAYGHGGRIVFINDLRALLSEPQRLAERMGEDSSIDRQQRRGRFADMVDEAINSYDGWLTDDDFDARGCLDRIVARLRQRRSFTLPEPPND